MKKIILKVGGMSCSACSNHVEKYLNKSKGIIDAKVNLVLGQALITYDDTLSIIDLKNLIEESGYEYLGVFNEKEMLKGKQNKIRSLIILSFLALILMYISMGHMVGLPNFKFLDRHMHPFNYGLTLFILTIPFLIYGRDILKKGFKNLFLKAPNMDTLVSIGVIFSFLYSTFSLIMIYLGYPIYGENLYFESAALVILFIKIGRYIDNQATEKTKEALKELVQITPSKAYLKVGESIKEVTIDEVKKDDILIAKPGMKIAVDGEVTQGVTHVDEAFITGEAKPSKKEVGSMVVAGALNIDGYIEYKAKKIGKDSTISEIVRLVVEASNTKAPIARLADKISSYFVPLIMGIALLTFLGYLILGFSFKVSLMALVTVLVVACPCALGLATPLAIVVSEGLCAKMGILVKSSEIFEKVPHLKTIVFDKTGTLTYGNLKIAQILNYSEYSNDVLISQVASIEASSNHPIAKAFLNYAQEKKLSLKKVTDFEDLPGMGLKGKLEKEEIVVGNAKILKELKIKNNYQEEENKLKEIGCSIVYVTLNKKIVGLIGIKDIVRDNAQKVIQKIQKLNLDVMMLTGDNFETAQVVANDLNIKQVEANKLPQEKTKLIKELMKNGQNVMMIGDGINDAPSLAMAMVGVSINSGTDIAADSSDVILMQDNLERIISLIAISKKTMQIIKENLFWAFFYNILMIPLAIGLLKPWGLSINPMWASLAMTISSLTVVLNSLRLRKIKE